VKVLEDYNAAEQEGVSAFQQSIHDGLRYSSSRGYVHDLSPQQLDVRTQIHVNKIIINNGRATGVEVTDKSGATQTFTADKEVILSAGVFGSPADPPALRRRAC
jgi:choline dehydrogenase